MVASSVAQLQSPSSSTNTKFRCHVGPVALHVISNAATLHLRNFLRRRRSILPGFPSSSSISEHFSYPGHLKHFSYPGHLNGLRDAWHESKIPYTASSVLHWSGNAISGSFISKQPFVGDSGEGNTIGWSHVANTASRFFSNEGTWTETLVWANVAVYLAQIATRGKLFYWGAKINSLISKGQIWRLITCAFLHLNLVHLMINCYSLSNIGPIVEDFSGSRRYLTVYFISAITGSAMSYWLCKSTSVGASGAIFGLIGAYFVILLRIKELIRDGDKELENVMKVIAINAAVGYFVKCIDNWAHIGGFLGGVATSWLLGPAYKLKIVSLREKESVVLVEEPPISAMLNDTSPTD